MMVKVYAYLSRDKKMTLDEIQKPMYDICVKMINDRSTDLRNMNGDYQLEGPEYFVSIRYSANHPVISLVENRERCSNIHTVFMEGHYVESIIDTFEREMSRRMRYREAVRKKEIADHLNRILGKFDEKKELV
jgi:hypothetical protein